MRRILINPKDRFSSPTSSPFRHPQCVFSTVQILLKNIHILLHSQKPLLVSIVLGGVGGRQGAQDVERTDRMSGEDGMLCPL